MNRQRIVISLRPRSWWGRALRAPWHFWQVLQIGQGHTPLLDRLISAAVTTRLLLRIAPRKGAR